MNTMIPSIVAQVAKPSPTMASGSSLPVAPTIAAKTTPNRLSPTISPVASRMPERLMWAAWEPSLCPAVEEAADDGADRDHHGERDRKVHAHADGQWRQVQLVGGASEDLVDDDHPDADESAHADGSPVQRVAEDALHQR